MKGAVQWCEQVKKQREEKRMERKRDRMLADMAKQAAAGRASAARELL